MAIAHGKARTLIGRRPKQARQDFLNFEDLMRSIPDNDRGGETFQIRSGEISDRKRSKLFSTWAGRRHRASL